ncbi:hypothetical protein V8687_23510 (plasmid) [Shewanella baltica]|uniref:hypothetical protein n=1 Tax=Shewanella baltica TaxID=62322 RepID=UPI0030D54AC0
MTNRSNQVSSQVSSGDTLENKIFRDICMLLRLKSIVKNDGDIADLLCESGLECSRKDVERWRTRPEKCPSGVVFKCSFAASSLLLSATLASINNDE